MRAVALLNTKVYDRELRKFLKIAKSRKLPKQQQSEALIAQEDERASIERICEQHEQGRP